MGGAEQSDYSRPTDRYVLAIGGEEISYSLQSRTCCFKKERKGEKKPMTPPLQGEEQCKELCVPAAAGSLPYQGVSQSNPLLYRAWQGSKELALGCTSRK